MTHDSQHEHEHEPEPAVEPPIDRHEAGSPAGRVVVRHRPHRFPGRDRVVKVRYDEQEPYTLAEAAGRAGLIPSGFLAAAGLSIATGQRPPAPMVDREVLGELLALRTAIVRYGVLVNQALAAWHSTGNAPVWLQQAMHGAHRAVRRVDEATDRLVRSR